MSKKKSGKVPLSATEALIQGRNQGTTLAMAIMFTALLDGAICNRTTWRAHGTR